jgi:hypothetical protein
MGAEGRRKRHLSSAEVPGDPAAKAEEPFGSRGPMQAPGAAAEGDHHPGERLAERGAAGS